MQMITIQEFRKQIRSDISIKDFQVVLLLCQRTKIKNWAQFRAYIRNNALMSVEMY